MMKKFRIILKLILCIIWAITIFMFSNQKADESTKLSNGVVEQIIEITNKDIEPEKKNELIIKYDHITRKLAHFTVYFILGLLVYELILEFNLNKKTIISIVLVILYAMSDEFHQTFINGRDGQIFDVLIDTFGGIIGISTVKLFIATKKKICKGD